LATSKQVHISTVIADELDVIAVRFKVGDRSDIFLPDAAANIALELLAASYAARAEQSVRNYAKKNGLVGIPKL
jgi:hypothetical protein